MMECPKCGTYCGKSWWPGIVCWWRARRFVPETVRKRVKRLSRLEGYPRVISTDGYYDECGIMRKIIPIGWNAPCLFDGSCRDCYVYHDKYPEKKGGP